MFLTKADEGVVSIVSLSKTETFYDIIYFAFLNYDLTRYEWISSFFVNLINLPVVHTIHR